MTQEGVDQFFKWLCLLLPICIAFWLLQVAGGWRVVCARLRQTKRVRKRTVELLDMGYAIEVAHPRAIREIKQEAEDINEALERTVTA